MICCVHMLLLLLPRTLACESPAARLKCGVIPDVQSISFFLSPSLLHVCPQKAPKTVSFDETMKEKDSPGGGGRRLRVRRRRGKRHHHHSRRRRQQRRSTRRSGYDCQGNSDDEDGCSCSSCCSSCSSSGSGSSSCSSSSSSDDEESFGLVWPTTTPTAASSLEGEGSAGPHARLQSGVGSQTLAHSATAAGSLTRPSRPDIKRQPNTACLIQ